jgi:chaperonin GroES
MVMDGQLVPMTVKVGDQVIFPKYKGTDIKYEGSDYIIIEESDLLAIVED